MPSDAKASGASITLETSKESNCVVVLVEMSWQGQDRVKQKDSGRQHMLVLDKPPRLANLGKRGLTSEDLHTVMFFFFTTLITSGLSKLCINMSLCVLV